VLIDSIDLKSPMPMDWEAVRLFLYAGNAEKSNNYYEVKGLKMCAYHPVEKVSWDDIQVFINKLNSIQNNFVYRLPTEAEWDYVARGGLPPEYGYGWGPEFDGAYAWYDKNSKRHTHQVATKLPIHPQGNSQESIYDMAGNVWQWVQDRYLGKYESLKKVDPVNCSPHVSSFTNFISHHIVDMGDECIDSGTYRVVRGGSRAYNPG
jgi:formylglycine-generating enzyme required for sulfatase activity